LLIEARRGAGIPAGIEFVDLGTGAGRQAERVDVPAHVVEVLRGLRVEAADGSDHLRAEQNVVHADDLEKQVDAGLVVDAGVEEDVGHD